jgi:hypothetical protein
LPAYRAGAGRAGLTSVLGKQGYYHSYGATIRPGVELEVGAFDAGTDLRFDAFEAIEELDVDGLSGVVRARDTRVTARAWVGLTPVRHFRIGLTAERNERAGRVGDSRAARSEMGAFGGIEVRF